MLRAIVPHRIVDETSERGGVSPMALTLEPIE